MKNSFIRYLYGFPETTASDVTNRLSLYLQNVMLSKFRVAWENQTLLWSVKFLHIFKELSQ
jgi:hypothetical protein